MMIKPPYLVICCLLLMILWLLSHPSCGPYTTRISQTRFAYTRPESSTLSILLKRAATEDRTVIVTMVNGEWAKPGSLLDLFLESYRIGERTKHFLNHVIVVALDDEALRYCNNAHPHCFLLRNSRINSAAEGNSTNPDGMAVSCHGRFCVTFVIWLQEADVMWLRNPIMHLHPQYEFTVACSSSSGDQQRSAVDGHGGFFYMKSNDASMELFKFLDVERVLFPANGKQSLCYILEREDVKKSLKPRVTYLDDANFMGFCQSNAQNLSNICTIHANCCHDTESKVNNLKLLLEDWRNDGIAENSVSDLSSLWRSSSKCKRTFSL